jgi:hypothetical protein
MFPPVTPSMMRPAKSIHRLFAKPMTKNPRLVPSSERKRMGRRP